MKALWGLLWLGLAYVWVVSAIDEAQGEGRAWLVAFYVIAAVIAFDNGRESRE